MDLDTFRALPKAELAHWIRKNPREAILLREKIYWHKVRLARTDPNEFCELVLRDESTGRPIAQAPIHEEFQHLALENDRLLLWAFVEGGKTQQVAIGHTLFELGLNPRLRFVVGSATTRYASRIVNAVKRYIEQPGPIHDIFPHLRPGPMWSQTAFVIDLPGKGVPKDPTVQATSVGTASLTGSRTDRLVLDDILNRVNTATPARRMATRDWYYSVPVSRLTEHAKVRILGNAFHPEDFMHELAAGGEFVWRKFPVLDKYGQPVWSDRWPIERVDRKRQETHPQEFARSMLCIPRDESEARFKREWIDKCLTRGKDFKPHFSLESVPQGCRVYTGVDLAVSMKSSADLCVFFTIMVHPNGDRQVLWVESGRFAGQDIVDKAIDHHQRFHSIVIVESVAAQDFIRQAIAHASSVPVRPFMTNGQNKMDAAFGVESIATEMANGKWIIPSIGGTGDVGWKPATKELEAWITEMVYYDPKNHTGDHLMAAWFAREGSRGSTGQLVVSGSTKTAGPGLTTKRPWGGGSPR